MDRLKFYLGEWNYTENYPKSPSAPNGATNTGINTGKSGPGGNSLINAFHSQGGWATSKAGKRAVCFRERRAGKATGAGRCHAQTLTRV
jgi:hypothetical protein